MIFVIAQMAVMSPVRQDIARGKLTLDQTLGTGACPDTYFYCQNQGHIGASIPSSQVRDGLCGMVFLLDIERLYSSSRLRTSML